MNGAAVSAETAAVPRKTVNESAVTAMLSICPMSRMLEMHADAMPYLSDSTAPMIALMLGEEKRAVCLG